MNLSNSISSLPDEKLREIYNSLIEADIRRMNNKDARAVLKRMEKQNSGKVKKIYAAFRKSKELGSALDIFYDAINPAARK